jgi:hypothetical protein
MAERIMFYRLPVEGAANVFESEFGPVEYLIVECEPGGAAPDGWLTDHTTVYGAQPAEAPKKRGPKPKPVEEPAPEPETE